MVAPPEAGDERQAQEDGGDSDEPPALLPAEHGGGDAAWEFLDLREAGRFVRSEARAAQEAAWSGTNLDARQIWGAREAQKIYRRQLRGAAAQLLQLRALQAGLEQPESLGRWLPQHLAARIVDIAWGKGRCMEFVSSWQTAPQRPGDLLVCVRKRPLLKFEAVAGEWDAVAVLPRDSAVLCHDGRLSRSGRQLLMTYRHFVVDRAWDASAGTEEVYRQAVAPLVQSVARGQGATLLCMGQTGTGKTYTIRGVLDCLAADLDGQGQVSVEFFEIYGKQCRDLLADGKEVQLRSDSEDRVHVCGQRTVTLPTTEGLVDVLDEALRLRASEATERNAASSRSHAVCTVRLASGGGVLRLVDLAGSERNFETTRMTAAQHRESAGINASLTVLKDCFRAHAARQRGEAALMPFRRSRLTRVLRDCFMDPSHRTAVIATVSPAAADVIHTVNTLRHATMLAKPLEELASEFEFDIPLHLEGFGSYKDVPVIEWLPEHVQAWLREAENGRFAHVVVPPALSGKQLLQCSPQALSELFEGELRRARAENEGEAWTVQVDDVGRDLGRELFAAARRTALAQSHAPGH